MEEGLLLDCNSNNSSNDQSEIEDVNLYNELCTKKCMWECDYSCLIFSYKSCSLGFSETKREDKFSLPHKSKDDFGIVWGCVE